MNALMQWRIPLDTAVAVKERLKKIEAAYESKLAKTRKLHEAAATKNVVATVQHLNVEVKKLTVGRRRVNTSNLAAVLLEAGLKHYKANDENLLDALLEGGVRTGRPAKEA